MTPTDPELPNPNPAAEMEEPDDFKAMLAGATVIFVVSFIPYAALTCCLPQIIGTLLALHLFTSKYALTITAGRGIKLGILTCLMGGIAAWAVGTAIYFLFNYQVGREVGEMMFNFGLQMAEKGGNQEAVAQMKEQFAQQQAQGLTMAQIALGLLFGVIFAAIAGLIGGAIGAALFKRGPKEVKQ